MIPYIQNILSDPHRTEIGLRMTRRKKTVKSRQAFGGDGIGVGQTGSLVSGVRQTREAGSTRQDRALTLGSGEPSRPAPDPSPAASPWLLENI